MRVLKYYQLKDMLSVSSRFNQLRHSALKHFLPRYPNRTFRSYLSLFMKPKSGLRIHARATCWGKRRRKPASVRGKKGRGHSRWRREGTSCRVKGRKSLQPVSERPVPGQSIKNVSRAEIIKVRISGGMGTMRDEKRRCMMQGSKKGDWEWVG